MVNFRVDLWCTSLCKGPDWSDDDSHSPAARRARERAGQYEGQAAECRAQLVEIEAALGQLERRQAGLRERMLVA